MCRTQHPARWAMVALAALCVVVLLVGCSAPQENDQIQDSGGAHGFSAYGTIYVGETPMHLLILDSDVIARVRLKSVKQVVEPYNWYAATSPYDTYVAALEFKFEALEYLVGSGGTELQAVAIDGDETFATRAEANGVDLLTSREQRWDDREAIVFLYTNPAIPSTDANTDRYFLGIARAQGEDGFTVATRWAKSWLPDAAAPSAEVDGARDASVTEQRFLLEAPPAQASGETRSAQSSEATGSVQPSTITMSELKTRIAKLEAEVDAAGGTPDHRRCVLRRYIWPGKFQREKERTEATGATYAKQHNKTIGSGLPAEVEVYVGGDYLRLSDEERQTEPVDSDKLVVKTGRDADLFAKGWPLTAVTARPLPAGEYRFYWAEQSYIAALCNAMPDIHLTRNEVVVTVTPPPGTLHEAFFDPVALGTGAGASPSHGVLKPSSFTLGGKTISMAGLKWQNGTATLTLSPYADLSGREMEFIALDGSIALSLDGDSGVGDSGAGTVTWALAKQPWKAGDKLMLRIKGKGPDARDAVTRGREGWVGNRLNAGLVPARTLRQAQHEGAS